ATQTPFNTMEKALEAFEVIKTMAELGNPNSVSDAGVGAICARSAVIGAFLNVKINAAGLKNKKLAEDFIRRGNEIERKAIEIETEILQMVNEKIGNI
ncbi:MAG: cyclodeaminase/cyclohydrolase family protein, partial [Bacteroidales bacterium]